MIRVLFRYMFTVPLVILGADGLTPHTEINENAFATGKRSFCPSLSLFTHAAMNLSQTFWRFYRLLDALCRLA